MKSYVIKYLHNEIGVTDYAWFYNIAYIKAKPDRIENKSGYKDNENSKVRMLFIFTTCISILDNYMILQIYPNLYVWKLTDYANGTWTLIATGFINVVNCN